MQQSSDRGNRMKEQVSLDGISLEIFRNALESIVDECFVGLMKSSYSSNIKERRDHSVALFDYRGRLVAQAKDSLPIHLSSLGGLIETIINTVPAADFAPGDIFIANDPYVAGGTHLPDLNFAMPLFHEGQLVCFIGNIAHHSDFGGMSPGSMAGGMTEIFQEGLRVPVVRLYRGGRLVDDVLSMVLLNTRVTEERQGDLLAQVAACRLAERRFAELLLTYNMATLRSAIDELIQRTERRLRSAIAEIPDGIYRYVDVMDDDGAGNTNLEIRLTVTVRGDHISLDFSGSSPQTLGNINCTANTTRSGVYYALKALLDPDVPNNQGALDAVECILPKGTILNAEFPASVASRGQTVQRIVDVVLGALSSALPERVVAAANGANTTAVFSGIRPGTADRYVYLETLGGGFGGRSTKDGKDGVQVHITNTSNLPVEVIESEYPLFVEKYELVSDSGGAGRYRGGLALRRVIQPRNHACVFSGSAERFVHRPWGLFGGMPGRAGSFCVRRADGTEERLPNKPAGVEIKEGEAVVITTPGAGGYGPPSERSDEALERDRVSAKFSASFLKQHY
jgi:N-methylhydantoinase B